jgi:hypothetical protein
VSDAPRDDDPEKQKGHGELVLLKSKTAKRRRARGAGDAQPILRLIDCRPSLFELFKRRRASVSLREVGERCLGRFAAFAASKLRR